MYSFRISFAVTVMLASAQLPLGAVPALIVSYDIVPQRVRAQNPDLAAARVLIREARGRAMNAGRLTNPELETAVENDARFGEWRVEVGFAQRFPVTNRLRLEKEIGRIELEAAEAEVRNVERELIATARQAIIEVLALRQRRTLLKQQKELRDRFAAFLGEAAGRGEASPLDSGQAKIEAASLDAELQQLSAREPGITGRLKTLLGMPPDAPVHIAGSLPQPKLAAPPVDPDRRADFQAKKLETEAAGRSVQLEQARKYDDLEAGLFVGAERTEDAPEGYEREAIIGFRIKVPLPLWNRNEGAIEEAAARRERKELETRALARGIRLEAEAAREEMVRWFGLLNEIEATLLPLADKHAEDSESAFRSGQGDLQTVFRSRERQLELASSRLDALLQFHLARVRLDAALGNSN